jgi:hypothetical protein
MCSGCSGRFDEDEEPEAEGDQTPPAPDEYEVWVTCDRIVERQVMRVKGPLFNEKRFPKGLN